MTTNPNAVRDMFRTLTPSLTVKGAAAAIDFYKQAFGAEEIRRMMSPDGDKIMHAELRFGDSMVMLNDEMLEMGCFSPETLKGVSSSIFMYVANTDTSYKQAVDAGAHSLMPPSDMFWGDRFAKVRDPFGQEWSIATHIEDLSEEEISKRQKAFFAQSAGSRG